MTMSYSGGTPRVQRATVVLIMIKVSHTMVFKGFALMNIFNSTLCIQIPYTLVVHGTTIKHRSTITQWLTARPTSQSDSVVDSSSYLLIANSQCNCRI